MNCSKCGAAVKPGDKFCSSCGSSVGIQYCPNCGVQTAPGAGFCPNCGKSLQVDSMPRNTSSPTPAGSNKNMPAGETVIRDTGIFPVAYIKNVMNSINGKLTLTNNYLVFKAGNLQGVGGVSAGGIFIPNPMDAGKSKTHFSIPLSSVTAVERGWSHITVHTSGQKYKFGGMTKTQEWETAINNARA